MLNRSPGEKTQKGSISATQPQTPTVRLSFSPATARYEDDGIASSTSHSKTSTSQSSAKHAPNTRRQPQSTRRRAPAPKEKTTLRAYNRPEHTALTPVRTAFAVHGAGLFQREGSVPGSQGLILDPAYVPVLLLADGWS